MLLMIIFYNEEYIQSKIISKQQKVPLNILRQSFHISAKGTIVSILGFFKRQFDIAEKILTGDVKRLFFGHRLDRYPRSSSNLEVQSLVPVQ